MFETAAFDYRLSRLNDIKTLLSIIVHIKSKQQKDV